MREGLKKLYLILLVFSIILGFFFQGFIMYKRAENLEILNRTTETFDFSYQKGVTSYTNMYNYYIENNTAYIVSYKDNSNIYPVDIEGMDVEIIELQHYPMCLSLYISTIFFFFISGMTTISIYRRLKIEEKELERKFEEAFI